MARVIAVGHTFKGLEVERAFFADKDVTLIDGNDLTPEDADWQSADGVMIGTARKLDAAAIAALSSCKVIVRYGMGYDNVDAEAAKARGILVGVLRDYCVNEVAEHTIASATAMARGLPMWDRLTRQGSWRAGANFEIRRFSELTYGVVGFGQIGRRVAEMAECLFGQVVVHDPALTGREQAGPRVVETLDELLDGSDLISLHAPSIPATRGMIGAPQLTRMRDNAILINPSRGDLVDEAALVQALENGAIGAAALDTFESEPIGADHPLAGAEHVLLSPHVAWKSREAEADLRTQTCRETLLALTEGRLSNPV